MTSPISGTNVRIITDVRFNNKYQHTRWFTTESDQIRYFESRRVVHTMREANFQRFEGKTFIACNAPIDDLFNANYLYFTSPKHGNKMFYAFVTHLEYVNASRTNIHFEIDVLQTWRFEMNIRESMVVREHCKQYEADGTPTLNLTDEGLDYGTDYEIVNVEQVEPKNGIYWLVIVAKSLLHKTGENVPNDIKSTNIGSPQPLSFYVHPFKMDGTVPKVSFNGSERTISSITQVLSTIYSQDDAVNNIVSLYVTESIGYLYSAYGNVVSLESSKFEYAPISDNTTQNIETVYVKDLKSFSSDITLIGRKYSGFNTVSESKLLLYPYAFAELTDLRGNTFPIKLEYIRNRDLSIIVKGSLGLSNKVAYQVAHYNVATSIETGEMMKVGLQSGIINNTPQDIPIITDMLSAFLQGNRNSLQTQENSIMFNGAMSVASSAMGGVSAGASKSVSGVADSAMGVVSGLGNTVLELQAMESKKQDINNTPPTLSKQGSNTAFDFGNGHTGFFIVKKQIRRHYRDKISDYFNMYGYKVNRLKRPNFKTRRYWNFVQTLGCNVTGSFNTNDLNKIASIFDNGITLWHTDDMLNYGLNNEVIANE